MRSLSNEPVRRCFLARKGSQVGRETTPERREFQELYCHSADNVDSELQLTLPQEAVIIFQRSRSRNGHRFALMARSPGVLLTRRLRTM